MLTGQVGNRTEVVAMFDDRGVEVRPLEKSAGAPRQLVIVAALNEEVGIGPTISELKENLGTSRILVVDGKSSDRTVEIAEKHGAEVIIQDGTGKGDAIAKALRVADLTVDYIVLTDADYTYPAGYIPRMIRILEENPRVGMVCGNRFTEHLDTEALHDLFYLGNRLLAFAHNLLNGVSLNDPLTGLRVMRAKILRNWSVKSKGFDVEVELNHQVERAGFTIAEVPIGYRRRLGEKKLRMRHGATILERIILEAIQHDLGNTRAADALTKSKGNSCFDPAFPSH